MIFIRADTEPFALAVSEWSLLTKGLDDSVRRHVSKLLDGVPENAFVDFTSHSTSTGETVVVAQPSNRFLRLLEALRAGQVDFDSFDSLFVHQDRSVSGMATETIAKSGTGCESGPAVIPSDTMKQSKKPIRLA